MLDFIAIRHGETDWNRQHRFQGRIDVPLNATGLLQAERLAERLADEAIDHLVVSDLLRARSTAAPLAAMRGLGIEPCTLWREQAFGVLEGIDVPTIRERHPDLWAQWIRHDADYALPGGGESTVAFHARILLALQAMHAAHAGLRVVLITHGGVLDMLWRTAHGISLSGPRDCEIPNAGLNRLRLDDAGQLTILAWADAAYLDGLPEQPSTAQIARAAP